MRMRNKSSTDYDVYCAVEGPMYDFRSELGRYFLCESKDWENPADLTTVQKFAGVLRGAKCGFGIIFSKHGISGGGQVKHAERELIKIKEQGQTIVLISEIDLNLVSAGENLFAILRDSYERERLDLPAPNTTKVSKRRKNLRLKTSKGVT